MRNWPGRCSILERWRRSNAVTVGTLLFKTALLPKILSSIPVATHLPENPQNDNSCKVSTIGWKTRHSAAVSLVELSRKWRVGINTARQTLKATTQEGIRAALHPLTRRCRTNHFSLRCCCLNTQFHSDTVFVTTKLLKGDKCAQVFAAKNLIRVHLMHSKQECAQVPQVFAEDNGIPTNPCTDGADELTRPHSEWRKLCRDLRVKTGVSEPHT
jgi:hypothetical protein